MKFEGHVIIVGCKQTATDIVYVCKKILGVKIRTVQPGKRMSTGSDFDEIQTGQREPAQVQVQESYTRATNALMAMIKRLNVRSVESKEHSSDLLINVDRQLESAFMRAADKAPNDMKRSVTDDTAPMFID